MSLAEKVTTGLEESAEVGSRESADLSTEVEFLTNSAK